MKRIQQGSLIAMFALAGAALAQSGGDYRLVRHVTAAGGGTSTGGVNYRLHGSIGQADASATALQSGGFSLRSGYWTGNAEGDDPEPGGDSIFADDFEDTGGTP